MFTSGRDSLGSKGSLSTGIVFGVIALSMVLCLLLLFTAKPTLVLAIVVASIFVLCTLVNPMVGVIALFALGMVGDLQHFENLPSLSVLLVPCVALGFIGRSLAARQRPRGHLVTALVLFVAIYCAGWCRGIESVGDLVGPAVFAGYATGFFLILNIVRTKSDIKMIFVAVEIGAALVAFALITQWFEVETPLSLLARPDLPMNSYHAAKDVVRTMGFANDPNAAAYPCILAAPVLLALAAASKRLWTRVPIMVLFAATVLGLATTQSRSGYLGLAVSVAVFMLLAGVKGRYWAALSLVILLGLAVTYMPIGEFTSRFATVQGDFQGDRAIQYQVGLSLFLQHPVFGAGAQAFAAEMLGESGIPFEPHSNLLSVLTHSGLAGFVPFLCFIVGYSRLFFQYWRKVKDRTRKLYAAGALAAVLGLQAQGLFIANMSWFLQWAIMAISICSLLAREDQTPDAATTRYVANHVWRKTNWRSEVSVT